MSIFKACDIRGVADVELTDAEVRRIGLALGTKLYGKTVVVGGDVRLSTPKFRGIVITSLVESGCKVINIGTVATPVFYYAVKTFKADGGVMVTASHNPARYNGLKLVLGSQPVSEEDIKEVERLAADGACISGQGSLIERNIIDEYIQHTTSKAAKGTLKVVLDAGNGAAGLIATRLFRSLGYEVVELYCQPDGCFPNHPPNPALAENLSALGQKVIETGADLGVGFDGDGDRVGFVDELGRPVDNDDIIVLVAKSYLEHEQGAVVYDSKCSMVVPEQIRQAGGRAVMARAGHTFSKAAFLREKALFAGEISGHFFFKELGYDDGMFAGLKICEFVAGHGSLAKMVDAVPNYLLTPDIRIKYEGTDKEDVLKEVALKLACYQPNLIDGVRVEFDDAWGMIRASVTEPLFTLRFEAKTLPRLREIFYMVTGALPERVRDRVVEQIVTASEYREVAENLALN